MYHMTKVFNYITDAFGELKTNVTWPTGADVQKYTIIVAIFSILFSLATWGVDTVFEKALGVFFNWIKG